MDQLKRLRTKAFSNLLENPLFAYPTILLLQLKVLWGIWWHRDLPLGDTASYFLNAMDWHVQKQTFLSWSPLYTAFYGTMVDLFRDAYAATIAHRVLIVLAATTVVLAIARRLLPAVWAWLVAAWWAILPINYDALYEVHMFAVIPILLSVWLAFALPGSKGRGACLAMLTASVILVRTELALGVIVYLLIVAALEWRDLRLHRTTSLKLVRAYLPPVICAVLAIGVFAAGAQDRRVFNAMMKEKHVVNLCESFAYGYQQRHPEWAKSPWTECYSLMQSLFGEQKPTFAKAFFANPAPLVEQVTWNASLIPNGLQLALFDATSGSYNPDFASVTLHAQYPIWLSVGMLLLLFAGSRELWKHRRGWAGDWVQSRMNGIVAFFPLVVVGVFAMLTQRPRPSYFFALTVGIMLFTAACAWAIARKYEAEATIRQLAPLFALLLIAAVPSHFRFGDRPLATHYARLAPFQKLFSEPHVVFASNVYSGELCAYMGSRTCTGLGVSSISRPPAFTDLETQLAAQGANLFYADETITKLSGGPTLLDHLEAKSWERVASARTDIMDWRLLRRTAAVTQQATPATALPDDIFNEGHTAPGQGWYGSELFHGERFRWVNNNAEILVQPHEAPLSLRIELEPGPGMGEQALHLHITRAKQEILTAQFTGRRTLEVSLSPSQTVETLRLRTDGGGLPAKGDSRILNFRVFPLAINPQ